MILDILEHTPVWVWIVFAALILLGLQQSRTRDVSIARATILPVVMIVLSLSGVVFPAGHSGASGTVPFALVAWAAGVGLSLKILSRETHDLILAAALLSIVLNPFVFALADRLSPTKKDAVATA